MREQDCKIKKGGREGGEMGKTTLLGVEGQEMDVMDMVGIFFTLLYDTYVWMDGVP